MSMPRKHIPLMSMLLLSTTMSHAEAPAPIASDWGGIGLLQTPTARMNEAGELGISLSHTSPYTRLNVMLQPFDWLEAGFRYIDISNRAYGASTTGQSNKDKSIDVKFRVVPETRLRPQLAVGLRDIGGTGLFAGEYVVANKRVADLDFSLGMGWGYLGSRGDFGNPLGFISQKFDRRGGTDAQGGTFNVNSYFRGRTALFGGIQYQTPYKPLLLKLEYEGNDYRSEPQDNDQRQTSPINVGLVYRVSPSIDLQAAWERGDTAMLGISFHTNLARAVPIPKTSEPAPVPLKPAPAAGQPVNWAATAADLENNAGWSVKRIRQRGREVIVEAEQKRYREPADAMDRAARILHNQVPADVDWFTLANETRDMRTADWSVQREAFSRENERIEGEPENDHLFQAAPPAWVRARTLYTSSPKPLTGDVGLGYSQSLGGPDAFLLYQFSVDGTAEWRLREDLWVSARASARVLDNYDIFNYTGPSKLPRVRTFLREYLTTSRVTLPNLQLNKTWQPGTETYALAYAGLLESMYGGAGIEWLYRPHGERWAIGTDLNVIQQRDFAQDFGFRDYRTVTGHVTGYLDTGIQSVQAKVMVGRYLAKDNGVTVDLSRRFRNGVSMGAFATLTDVSREEFGEGSFDKGIYFNIPFDLMLGRSTRNVANLTWNPLTRDGGQRLLRRYTLFELTEDRDKSFAR